MADEWICQDCNYATDEAPSNDKCPSCGGSMLNLGKVDEDLKPTKDKQAQLYDDEDLKTPIEKPVIDDDGDEDVEPNKSK